MGLVAAEFERQGITSVAIQLLRMVTEQVRPPRALMVPFRHGYPLGNPNDPEQQHRVIRAALDLMQDKTVQPPCIVEYEPKELEAGVQP